MPEVVGVPTLKGAGLSPGDAGLVVPVLSVLPGIETVGDEPTIPVEGGFPTIVLGMPDAGVGTLLVPAPPLVTPVAVPEDVPDGVDAAPVGVLVVP